MAYTTKAGSTTTEANGGQYASDTPSSANYPTLAADSAASAALSAASAAQSAIDAQAAATVQDQTHAAASKVSPENNDELPLVDSSATYGLKKLTWANMKAALLAWLQGTVFPSPGAIGGATPAAGSFTTLSATGGITNTAATSTSSYLTGTNGSGVVTSIGVAADNGSLLGTTSSHNLRIATGGAVQATLDTSGNLGLGVTPSAWGGSFKAIELIGGNTITSYPNAGITAMYLGSNAYFNGTNWIYKATSPSAIFTINDNAGVFKWETAPSGTAGNPITFTQALAINTSNSLQLYSAPTVSAPAYSKGALYFDTTLNKLRVGGATAWETVTSV